MSQGPAAAYPAEGAELGTWSPRLPHNRTYILPEHRVMFVSVAKNACTSLKWMLAGLSGQDPRRFHEQNYMQSDIAHTIHRRGLWEGVPRLGELAPQQRAEIHPDNGWFIFGVVRDPRARLFSAWQSKLLNRDPGYLRYRDQPFYPRLPTSTDDVVEEFARFVRYLVPEREHKIAVKDVHFGVQSELLATDLVPYSRIYEVKELGRLVADLTEHLAAVGRPQQVRLPRENSTPLEARQLLFGGGVHELIQQRYAADFAEFGHLWSFDDLPSGEPNWPKAVFSGFAATAAAYEQIYSLSQRGKELERRLARMEKRQARQQQRPRRGPQPPPPPGPVHRVSARLRRLRG